MASFFFSSKNWGPFLTCEVSWELNDHYMGGRGKGREERQRQGEKEGEKEGKKVGRKKRKKKGRRN